MTGALSSDASIGYGRSAITNTGYVKVYRADDDGGNTGAARPDRIYGDMTDDYFG